MEKLKSIVDTLDFLSRYPGWLKMVLGIWGGCTLGLLVTLVALYPRETSLRILRISLVPDYKRGIAIQFWVANRAEQPAALVALELSFYAAKVAPGEGSLQTTEKLSGRYIVTGEARNGGLAATINQETERLPVSINFPLPARKDYALFTLNLAQKVPAKGTDRFQVAIEAEGLPPPGAKYIEAILHYDDGEKTLPKELAL